ncbi:MAG: C1 family peptidase [Alphaproteobacteria bacterium]|nr:C1 family peptidase [Alphaproteobacteria bacterium]
MARKTARARAARTPAAPPTNRINGKLLDARRDRLDLRDRPYQPPLRSLPDQFPNDEFLKRYLAAYIKAGLILDQGDEGACTGFGLSCVVNYLLFVKGGAPAKFERVSPRMVYHLARLYDEWPGEDYEGSSCRGALKGWHKHGVCGDRLWPYFDKQGRNVFVEPATEYAVDALRRTLGVYYRIDKASVVDMQAAIQEIGAVYCSADVHAGWWLDKTTKAPSFANLPVIRRRPKEKITGGHAFALVGYNDTGFVIQNSWGTGWGLSGFAILPYEDWADNGFDAWACALGVPKPAAERASAARTAFVQSDRQSAQPRRAQVAFSMRRPDAAAESRLRLGEDEAYERTVVFGNDGFAERRIVHHASIDDTVAKLGNDIPAAWFDKRRRQGDGKERLVVYAHGGLNSEPASLKRIRALGHVFQDNGIYPLFLTWKTGTLESLSDILSDELEEIAKPAGGVREFVDELKDKALEAKDRALEVAARRVLVRALWDQMKQNAEAASIPGRGAAMLGAALNALAAARGDRLEIHLVGHSAGSIILGGMLRHLPARIASCTLYAPACTVAFANATYRPAVESGQLNGRKLRVHNLSDEREREDAVGPYGKSLLYLVSRALEPVHKTPILGLARSFDPRFNGSPQWNDENAALRDQFAGELKAWQKFWSGLPGDSDKRLVLESRGAVPTGCGPGAKMIDSAHGCFDNHAEVIDDTMATILGRRPENPSIDLEY